MYLHALDISKLSVCLGIHHTFIKRAFEKGFSTLKTAQLKSIAAFIFDTYNVKISPCGTKDAVANRLVNFFCSDQYQRMENVDAIQATACYQNSKGVNSDKTATGTNALAVLEGRKSKEKKRRLCVTARDQNLDGKDGINFKRKKHSAKPKSSFKFFVDEKKEETRKTWPQLSRADLVKQLARDYAALPNKSKYENQAREAKTSFLTGSNRGNSSIQPKSSESTEDSKVERGGNKEKLTRAKSALNFFIDERRAEAKKTWPQMSRLELMKQLFREYAALSDKSKYEEKARLAKEYRKMDTPTISLPNIFPLNPHSENDTTIVKTDCMAELMPSECSGKDTLNLEHISVEEFLHNLGMEHYSKRIRDTGINLQQNFADLSPQDWGILRQIMPGPDLKQLEGSLVQFGVVIQSEDRAFTTVVRSETSIPNSVSAQNFVCTVSNIQDNAIMQAGANTHNELIQNPENKRPSALSLPNEKNYHVFLSHRKPQNSDDSEIGDSEQFAILIKMTLTLFGFRVFFDKDDLPIIDAENLRTKVAESCSILVILDSKIVESHWCKKEWDWAAQNNIPCVPIYNSDVYNLKAVREIIDRLNAEGCQNATKHQAIKYSSDSGGRELFFEQIATRVNGFVRDTFELCQSVFAPNEWFCQACTFGNHPSAYVCEVCCAPSQQHWACKSCTCINPTTLTRCETCETQK